MGPRAILAYPEGIDFVADGSIPRPKGKLITLCELVGLGERESYYNMVLVRPFLSTHLLNV